MTERLGNYLIVLKYTGGMTVSYSHRTQNSVIIKNETFHSSISKKNKMVNKLYKNSRKAEVL